MLIIVRVKDKHISIGIEVCAMKHGVCVNKRDKERRQEGEIDKCQGGERETEGGREREG